MSTLESNMTVHHSQLIINGEKRLSSSGETFENYHPGTGEHIGHTESASSDDIRDAIEAASAAFPAWERTPAAQKRAIFNKAADLLLSEKYLARFRESIPEETGAVVIAADHEARDGARQFRDAACLSNQIIGETYPSARVPGGRIIVEKRAYGVILAIAPWNSAINLAARATSIPLVCGNTVILKSSEVCPRSHSLFVEALHEAGLPKGVVNLLHVSREMSPKRIPEIIAHPLIKHVNFTGSDRVGRILATEAAKHLKPTVMELGGKSAAVVLNDANIKRAARGILSGAMLGSGQICMSTERVIVQREASEALIAEITAIASKMKAGPNGADNHISGVFSKASAENIVSLLREAEKNGAEVLVGDVKNEGSYVQPHVLLGYTPDMRIWQEESFGPVVGITVVDTVDEAIDLANATDFTLTSSLWTTNIKALEIAARLRVGSVMINGSTFHPEPYLEIHGIGGRSGWGRYDIENFTQRRLVIVHPDDVKFPLVDDLGL